ncbi:two-component sensor histidine kinase [Pigmentiphaga litoralis]|uniref:DUF4118 domain-containing protein n=1 Tax=Pigmentiphaga litoralis TaxID=516702 RepID=UPI0016719BA3|nr:DUF4118 domain-containing protein [Pigmentiphaga litoralis]GGX10272.1 two-component sensor histidine kinase [Pigmentiphaga litoralis]
MTAARPDPDQLLDRLRGDALRAGRGHLRIYIGASAGAGKTCAMLAAAHDAVAKGVDVVIGVVETHGRADTAARVEGLARLPLRTVTHRGRDLAEFDLDAALARRPGLLLVDELAHSNAPGSRHPKRWQDVEDVLAAGIDVLSTLNIQHLESLNDVVAGIVGIRVQETLPDSVFDNADDVVMVDVPADELLARLKAGKVYVAPQAERAAQHFFRKGNLIALRELALRRMADRMQGDVQDYRDAQSIRDVWRTQEALLACIGPGPEGEHVARSAARLAGRLNITWHAVYVETPALQHAPRAKRMQVLSTLHLAETLSATTAVLTGADVAHVLVDYAREHNLSTLVMGPARPRGLSFWLRAGQSGRAAGHAPWRSVASAVSRCGADLDVIRIGAARSDTPGSPGTATRVTRSMALRATGSPSARRRWTAYLWPVLGAVIATACLQPLSDLLEPTNIAMLFLLGVVGVAVRHGRGPAALAALLNVAAFDLFFIPPILSFTVNDAQYVLTFGVMLAVGLVVGQLTAGLRFQARIAAHRETRARKLFEFARDLSGALQREQVVESTGSTLSSAFGSQVVLLLPGSDDALVMPANAPGDLDPGIAQWACDQDRQAGLGTDTLPASAFRYVPLRAPMRIRGVLAIRPEDPRWLMIPEQQRQLDTFASLIAIALERVHYADVARQTQVGMEAERLRNSLLSAMSHDIRTPLTVLAGLAESLATVPPALSPDQQEQVHAIRIEVMHMSTLVANLLDMARIQSGAITLRREWQSLEEIVGTAIQSVRRQLGPRTVAVSLPADLPLVRFDAVLIERVLANLLENAAKYTPSTTRITLSASCVGKDLRVTVADDGPGLPPGRADRLFDKFTRGDSESATPGVGLGLAICRAIIDAHGGHISAGASPEGGAAMTFTLPLGTPPVIDADAELPVLPETA